MRVPFGKTVTQVVLMMWTLRSTLSVVLVVTGVMISSLMSTDTLSQSDVISLQSVVKGPNSSGSVMLGKTKIASAET